jgi:hypothetical protein
MWASLCRKIIASFVILCSSALILSMVVGFLLLYVALYGSMFGVFLYIVYLTFLYLGGM